LDKGTVFFCLCWSWTSIVVITYLAGKLGLGHSVSARAGVELAPLAYLAAGLELGPSVSARGAL